LSAATLYWDIGELGDMHHNPARNVLHRKYSLDEVAVKTRKPTGNCNRSSNQRAANCSRAHAAPYAIH